MVCVNTWAEDAIFGIIYWDLLPARFCFLIKQRGNSLKTLIQIFIIVVEISWLKVCNMQVVHVEASYITDDSRLKPNFGVAMSVPYMFSANSKYTLPAVGCMWGTANLQWFCFLYISLFKSTHYSLIIHAPNRTWRCEKHDNLFAKAFRYFRRCFENDFFIYNTVRHILTTKSCNRSNFFFKPGGAKKKRYNFVFYIS